MPTPALPQPGQPLAERTGQPGRISQIGELPGTSVNDHAPPATSDRDHRTCSASLHPASAFRDRNMWTLDKSYFP